MPRLPFHESIVDVIRSAGDDDYGVLCSLITDTKIPANHDAIIVAWEKRWEAPKDAAPQGDDAAVLSLREQKQEAEARERFQENLAAVL